jgi:hypothetical protein
LRVTRAALWRFADGESIRRAVVSKTVDNAGRSTAVIVRKPQALSGSVEHPILN